jgi:hypothetical protein
MSVFLRWGVFGILAVAALIYAYNANKKGAELRSARPSASAAAAEGQAAQSSGSPECEEEYVVVQSALAARNANEPLDRLLRQREIAWVSSPRRKERLIQVATHWYRRADLPADIHAEVIRECVLNGPVAPVPGS